jgi:RNase P subunit RPR2
VNEQCDRCHGAEPKPGFNHQRRSGWALKQYHEQLDCKRCHTKKNVFVGLSGTCTTCHKAWTPENFRHAVAGLALDQTHVELTCDVCHADQRFVAKPSCGGCHEQFSYPEKSPGKRVKRLAVAKGK